ncbi:MAG: F0F1 ATP synthase subunit B [Bacteroidales bacterium]|nr:F0F1 ATP synthase subunit B [Bacteroidales bacterium]
MDLFKADFGLMFWMFVGFLILFLILWKFAWPVILKTVDKRADLIDKGVEYAQNAKIQLDNAQQQADRMLQQTRTQQAEMLRDADRMKTQIIEEARGAAQKEAQKVMDAARLSIEQQQKQAEKQFRDQVSDFALNIARKVVRKEMDDPKAQSQLVNTYLDEIENSNDKNVKQ